MSMFTIRPSQTLEVLKRITMQGLVPYLQGPPGVGKSALVHQLADLGNLKMIDERMSQAMPEDLKGFPMRSGDGSKAHFVPFDTFPVAGDPLPLRPDGTPYAGWLIFLDELSSAPKAVQAAAYKIILDKKVGSYDLHPNVVIVAAGNRMGDKAVVIEQSTALRSRLIQLEMVSDPGDFVAHGNSRKYDYRVLAYAQWKPGSVHDFDPQRNDKTFACPRTWEFVSRLIKGKTDLDALDQIIIVGAVGDAHGVKFFQFCQLMGKLPDIRDILADPTGTAIPPSSDLRYAILTSLMDHATLENFARITQYVIRFPADMQVIFFRGVVQRDLKFRTHPDYAKNITSILRFISEEDKHYAAV